jgi:nucleotide-binding universal stress UspA family protein
MTTTSTTTSAIDHAPRATDARTSFPMLVALNDDACGDSAVALAQALVRERGADPTVLHVVEVGAGIGVGVSMLVDAFERDPEFVSLHTGQLRRRFRGAAAFEQWPVTIRVGDASAGILEVARQLQPALIVMGLGRHGRVGRAVGDDATRDVMREGVAPVLALPPLAEPYRPSTQLPGRVLVAMDFSAASMRAARLARRIMRDGGVLHLAHVRFPLLAEEGERYEGMHVVHTAGVEAAFEAAVRELSGGAVTVTTTVCDGDPATALLELAERVQPDLIAIGSQRHHWLERMLLGSVARAIADDGRWPVLVTPPQRRPVPLHDDARPAT